MKAKRSHTTGPIELSEAMAHAWMLLVQHCERVHWMALPDRRGAPPRPRAVGVPGETGRTANRNATAFALVPGAFLDRLLGTHAGYGQTVRYLASVSQLVTETVAAPGGCTVLVWTPDKPLGKPPVVQRALRDAGVAFDIVDPSRAGEVTAAIVDALRKGAPPPNVVVEGWAWLLDHGPPPT